VLPVYNGEAYLQEAISSVLGQSFSDLELIIINDGALDRSAEIIRSIDDARVTVITHEKNKGLVQALNSGLDAACGKFIARMDQDDVCHPRRLEKQVAFLEKRSEIGICGTWARVIGSPFWSRLTNPLEHEEIRAGLLFGSPLIHPSAMFRGDLIGSGMRYADGMDYAEDYDFWSRASGITRLANIPEALLFYRKLPGGMCGHGAAIQRTKGWEVRLRELQKLGVFMDENEKGLHARVSLLEKIASLPELGECLAWLEKLFCVNQKTGYLDSSVMARVLGEKWFYLCLSSADLGPDVFRVYTKSKWGDFFDPGLLRLGKMGVKCLLKK